ncbi:NAD(P)-binding protein [Trichodelitschia bisporula]|uniref:NAD(P)-binding protein n=1 Tax=Trichodelitschia bisporula TaxID=703511 RepID=A0A6G1HWM6_9PEZI|nr:NAD(P)-binding protein [Trichodelitschia bisporula]
MSGGEGESKPAVLIIGGLGYIGRFLALHLHTNSLASEVRLVDKHLPELAWLAPEFAEACSRDKFMQADASQPNNLPRIFNRANGKEFDYVINCGGETRYQQEDEVYRVRSLQLSTTIGAEAARRNVKCFIELSTGMVYKPGSSPRAESAKQSPWIKLATWKQTAERELSAMEGLNLVVLRLAHVYGPYTPKFVGTALCMARVYQYEQREMKWLYSRDLKTNTVHVKDVVRAIWTAAQWYAQKNTQKRPAPVFNIADQGNTAQGTMADIITQIFNIPTNFQNPVMATIAKFCLDSVVDDVNDETLDPWAELQEAAGITKATPLGPYMEKDLLKNLDLSLDPSAFVRETGFQYQHPKLTKEEIEAVIESYRSMNWWP